MTDIPADRPDEGNSIETLPEERPGAPGSDEGAGGDMPNQINPTPDEIGGNVPPPEVGNQ